MERRVYWYGASNALDDTRISLGFLPLVNQTGDLAITADRIDNRDELIAALALTTSDPKKNHG